MTEEDRHREILEIAYKRLLEKLEAKDVTVDGLKAAAVEALGQARQSAALDLEFISRELERLRTSTPKEGAESPAKPGPDPSSRQQP